MAAVDEGLQNILLDVQVIVIDRRQGITESWEIFHRFAHAVIADIVASRLGAQHEVIGNVLLDEAVAVMAVNHRIGQVHVCDLGLQLAAVILADPAPEDHTDLAGLTDCAIGIEQTLAECVEGRATAEDEVVAKFHLREERPRRCCIWQTGGRPNGTVRSILNSPRFAKTSGIQRLSAFSVSRTGRAPTLGGPVLLKARLVQICEVSKRDTLFPANRKFHVCGASLSMSIARRTYATLPLSLKSVMPPSLASTICIAISCYQGTYQGIPDNYHDVTLRRSKTEYAL